MSPLGIIYNTHIGSAGDPWIGWALKGYPKASHGLEGGGNNERERLLV